MFMTMLVAGIMSVLYLLDVHTLSNSIVSTFFENSSNLQSTVFYAIFTVAILALVGFGSAVIVGFFGTNLNTEGIYAVAASALLLMFIGDIISIFSIASTDTSTLGVISGKVLIFIMIPIAIAYLFSILDWIRGGD